MARAIDMTKMDEWSQEEAEENLRYMRDRGRTLDGDKIAAKFGIDESAVPEEEEFAEEGELEEESYADWTVDDLRNELRNRELSKSGNRDELIARLEANDAEQG